MSLDSVTVVIRSVGERTESLCKKLILAQGLADHAVFITNEAPFSKAMRVGFEIGIAENRPWVLCVDADVLLRPNSISRLMEHARKQQENVCELQGYVLDKFLGGVRTAGNHLYRTSLLKKVINSIPPEGRNIRPETHALNTMRAAGYPWCIVKELVGLHDFEQSYEDIFRKCFVHAHKHLRSIDLCVPYWRAKVDVDADYRIALAGFAEGIKHFGEVRIDKRAQYFHDTMQNIDIGLKNSINLDQWGLDVVESLIQRLLCSSQFMDKHSGAMSASGDSVLSRAAEIYRQHRRRKSVRTSSMLVLSWILMGLGRKLRNQTK